MKATVIVRLKPEVLDVQGSAVQRALGKLGFEGVSNVRIGKIVELEIADADGDVKALEARLAKMAKEMLANPVIEDFETRIQAE
jgi:phosphoribosylformylglycinamidine synthase